MVIAGLVLAGTAFGFGLFKPGHTFITGGRSYAVAIGDLNRDGKADIVAATEETGNDRVSVFRGRENGTFQPEISLPAGTSPEGVAIGDLNGDRRKDILAANYDDSTVSVLIQKTNGQFRDGGTLGAGPGAWQVAIADLNRDGRPDIVTANYSSSGPDAVSVLLGKGAAQFRAHQDYASGDGPYGFAIGRMNADKRPDVVTIDSDGNPSVLLAKSNGALGAPKNQTVPGGDSYDPALGDFNRDGNLDVAIANYTDETVMVLRGSGDGRLKPPISTGATALGPNAMAAGDFNRDGKLDLAVGFYKSPFGFAIYRGKGNGQFKPAQLYPGSDKAEAIAPGRLNGDKGLDVVIGTDGGVDFFLNKP